MQALARRLAPMALALAAGACASGARAPNHFVTGRCPVPDDVRGFPVVVSAERAELDPAWLAQWAHVAAQRWQVPSRRRAQYAGYRNVSQRVVPATPRWADDWSPTGGEHADLVVAVSRLGFADDPEVRDAEGDELFQGSLPTFATDPLPASPRFPPLPASAPDTVRLHVRFGVEPAPGEIAGVARFARQQRPVRVLGSLAAYGPLNGQALVKYDVDALGRFVPGSFQMMSGSSPELARGVEQALGRARFVAAQTDCQPVPLTVVQSFGR